MNSFPKISTQRLAVKLKPKAEKLVKQGHPWVFADSIVKLSKKGQAGDIAILFDQHRDKAFAVGLYDPESPIRIKMIAAIPTPIDTQFFEKKVEQAYQKRHPLLQTNTDSYRLIFGENDGLPGLIADVYANVLVIKLYSPIWWPYMDDILPCLIAQSHASAAVLRLSRSVKKEHSHGFDDGEVIYGHLEQETVLFNEHGIRFSANVIQGHKTGYFLDHRANRKRVGDKAMGKSVLDVFSYAGGFSVHALAGGAREVTSVDISAKALAVAQFNASLNRHKGTHEIIAGDAFEILEQLRKSKRLFDVVVIDPPSFAKSAKEVSKALFQYERLARLGARLVVKGGMLVLASCSSRVSAAHFFSASTKGIVQSGASGLLVQKTGHDIDHPVTFPEGAYLKCGYWKMK